MAKPYRPAPSPVPAPPAALESAPPQLDQAAVAPAATVSAPSPVAAAPPIGPIPGPKFGKAPQGMITEAGGHVEKVDDNLPKGMISELTVGKPKVKPLNPIMEKQTVPPPAQKPRSEVDDLNAPKAHVAETDLAPLKKGYAPTKKGAHPVEFPAQATVNGKVVTITEQASWTDEDGSIYRTDEGDLLAEKKVQFLRG